MADGGSSHTHSHGDLAGTRLVLAVVVNVILTLVQIIGGILSGSLALIADAIHNFSDAASLGIALFARRISRRDADETMTFGYSRAEPIAALINLTTLIVIGIYLLYEAALRFFSPEPIQAWTVIIVATVALIIDIATALLVYGPSRGSMNIKAAFLHNVADALASVAVIVSGIVILLYQAYWVDLAVTVLISAYILVHGFHEIGRAIKLLMDAVPPGMDLRTVAESMAGVAGVIGVHHLHVRELGEHTRALEAHVVVDSEHGQSANGIKASLRRLLHERFNIQHATLELETDRPEGKDKLLVPPHAETAHSISTHGMHGAAGGNER